MNRFERHPVLTLVTVMLVMLVAFIALAEWLIAPEGTRIALIGNESSPRPDRFLQLREWQPDTRFAFGPPEIRVANARREIPEVYVLETDDEGFIQPSVIHEEPDFEVVFVGGSTTECLYVLPENRFPYVVGRRLEDHTGLKVNGINAGKAGNNTMHSLLATIGKVLPRRPDAVVLMQATNDIGVLNRSGSYWNDDSNFALVEQRERTIETVFKDLRDISVPFSYRRLRRALKSLAFAEPLIGHAFAATENTGEKAGETKTEKRARLGADFESALRSFVSVVRAWHVEPVLMTQVAVREEQDSSELEEAFLSEEALAAGQFTPESFSDTHAYFNAIIRHVALSERVMLIDLAAARDWSAEDLYDGIHFNDQGARRVGELVADALAKELENHPTVH